MAAGIMLHAKLGDHLEEGQPLATLYSEKEDSLREAKTRYLEALCFRKERIEKPRLIYDIIRES